ncbi:cyclic AMP-dependent transcription factor ATF-4 [Stegostoma tigrinum]|uniref:cyclic AMP-dependent transcription factor ATF-4 n=1 Tax=Stegostoma tigrinum TaxID=3053191 RepID=UPI00202B87B4|nr:cyclic AMP-dependent transcription factor ATF-4 [Stegostoma tigrinum]
MTSDWPDSFSSLMEDFMMSPSSPFLTAEGDPCLLHTDLAEAGPVKSYLRPLLFDGNEESDVSSLITCVDKLLDTDDTVEDAFTGFDWMEKTDLFDNLFMGENGSPSSEELLAVLDSSCVLEELPFDPLPAKLQVADLGLSSDHRPFPNSPPGSDQLAPSTPTITPESLIPTPDHLLHFLENETGVSCEEFPPPLQDSVKEEDDRLMRDSDSGVGTSPPHSPAESSDKNMSEGSPQTSGLSSDDSSPIRPKPYDRPSTENVGNLSKVKVSVESRGLEKKLKKMEQNKSAATRYRQKKRAEHGAILAECSLLEEKNKTLQEKADSLTKEIQYLKDLIEEVRKAKSSRTAKSL